MSTSSSWLWQTKNKKQNRTESTSATEENSVPSSNEYTKIVFWFFIPRYIITKALTQLTTFMTMLSR